MENKEIENLAFVFQIGQLVKYTAESIINDDNLLRSEGQFMFDGHKFNITVEEAGND